MQNLKNLSNEVLLSSAQALVAEERKLTTSVLWHLHEIQRRRLYAEKGYASLFEYAVQSLGYSEAAAGRRIAAMRLLVEVPEIEPALEAGQIHLSTLNTIQHFIQRKEEPISKSEKKELVLALQGKSRRECEKVLTALDPVAATPKERERVVSSTQTEIRFVADDSLMEKLQKIRELDAHVQCETSYLELFHRMADLVLKKRDPLSKNKEMATSDQKSISTPPAELDVPLAANPVKRRNNPRRIPAALRREIWRRDRAQCTYTSPDGRRCTSKYALEVDHKIPVAWNGISELSNLQLLCREHNRLKAIVQLGKPTMDRYLR